MFILNKIIWTDKTCFIAVLGVLCSELWRSQHSCSCLCAGASGLPAKYWSCTCCSISRPVLTQRDALILMRTSEYRWIKNVNGTNANVRLDVVGEIKDGRSKDQSKHQTASLAVFHLSTAWGRSSPEPMISNYYITLYKVLIHDPVKPSHKATWFCSVSWQGVPQLE